MNFQLQLVCVSLCLLHLLYAQSTTEILSDVTTWSENVIPSKDTIPSKDVTSEKYTSLQFNAAPLTDHGETTPSKDTFPSKAVTSEKYTSSQINAASLTDQGRTTLLSDTISDLPNGNDEVKRLEARHDLRALAVEDGLETVQNQKPESKTSSECENLQLALTVEVTIKTDCGWNVVSLAKQHQFMMLTIRNLDIQKSINVAENVREPGCIKIQFVDSVFYGQFTGYRAKNKILREELIGCEFLVPPKPYIYILTPHAAGVIIKKTRAADSFSMTVKTASAYGKNSLDPCPSGYTECSHDRRVCILVAQVCDGFADCADGEEEDECTKMTGRW